MQPSNKIAIIGAGIGGLASGYFLQEAGRQAEIFERAAVPGGRIQLLEKDGACVDVGTQYFHTNYVETLKLLDAVGLKDQLRSIRPPVEMMRGGKGYLVRGHRAGAIHAGKMRPRGPGVPRAPDNNRL